MCAQSYNWFFLVNYMFFTLKPVITEILNATQFLQRAALPFLIFQPSIKKRQRTGLPNEMILVFSTKPLNKNKITLPQVFLWSVLFHNFMVVIISHPQLNWISDRKWRNRNQTVDLFMSSSHTSCTVCEMFWNSRIWIKTTELASSLIWYTEKKSAVLPCQHLNTNLLILT